LIHFYKRSLIVIMTEDGWIDCMSDLEPNLLEVSVRSRGFLPANSTSGFNASSSQCPQPRTYDTSKAIQKLILNTTNPFSKLNIEDTTILDTLQERQPCDRCYKSRKFFCYSCYLPLHAVKSIMPTVKLPIQIDIVKHAGEVDGKSTAVHAKVLAANQVNIYTFPDFPDYNKDDTVLVFPGPDSYSLSQLKNISMSSSTKREFQLKRIVFIDSTWNQCYAICQDERIKSLDKVMIESRETMFWRYQTGKPKEYLSTIEAIYYLCVDYHTDVLEESYSGEYDNLLYFFKFMFEKIHNLYTTT